MKRILLCVAVIAIACSSSRDSTVGGEIASLSFGSDPAAAEIARSAALERAQAQIDSGHPWRATKLMAAELRDSRQRTPAAVLVAARAAAGWDGWPEVEKLLAKETWLDARFEGEGRELLTRSALERGADTVARTRAVAALRDAKTEPVRAARLTLLARALERNNVFDSAAAAYARAAETLKPVRSWLYLRAAGSEVDSSRRAALFAKVAITAAKPRVAWTEAQARERFGDALGAASRFAALGSTVQALRLRLSVAPDTAARDVVRNELLDVVRTRPNTADARSAVDVLDRGFTSFAPGQELVIARGTSSSVPARAVAGFARAASLLTPADRMAYAQALARLGRSREALAQLQMVRGPLAGQAAYQRSRILLTSSTRSATVAALRATVTGFAADTGAASAALFLLADLETDTGNDVGARALYQQLYRSYPSSARAANARFNAAIIAFANGSALVAAREFDSLVTVLPRSDETIAALFWSGRAWANAGSPSLAKERWQRVTAQQPMSYYAFTSARRLGAPAWVPQGKPESVTRVAAVDSALARIALLERLGMDVEARFEYDALDESADASAERLATTAHALVQHGQASRAIRLGQKLVDAGHRDVNTYRLLYPLFDRDELSFDAKTNALDPVLVAALIRQESAFNPRAVSVAGARGLMQVLPAVGQEVARSLAFPVWYPALLFDPDANLQIGTAHLAMFIKQHGAVPRALAAYNAGGSRVARWVTKAGADDPELFAERIPFAETRDYVRIVQRNAEIYRQIYKW